MATFTRACIRVYAQVCVCVCTSTFACCSRWPFCFHSITKGHSQLMVVPSVTLMGLLPLCDLCSSYSELLPVCLCVCVCVCTYICVHACQVPPVPMLQSETANSLMKCLQTGKVAALRLGHLTCEAGVGLLPLIALRLVHTRRDM